MNITIECPSCKQQYSVDASVIGEEVECAVCKNVFVAKKKPIKLELSNNTSKVLSKRQDTPYNVVEKTTTIVSKVQQSHITHYIIALFVCALLFVLYLFIVVWILDFDHYRGLGFIPTFIGHLLATFLRLFFTGLLFFLWKSIWVTFVPPQKENKGIVSENKQKDNTIIPSPKENKGIVPENKQKDNTSVSQIHSSHNSMNQSVNQIKQSPSNNKETNSKEHKKQSIGKPQPEYDTPSRRISLLIEQHDWDGALAYCQELLESDPSPGRQAQLWQIKVKASDFYLQRCMKKHNIKDISDLYLCKTNLLDDDDFVHAINCAVPEQVDILNNALRKQKKKLK